MTEDDGTSIPSDGAAAHPRLSLIAPLIVLLVTAAVYAPALGYGFVLDDGPQIVESQPYYTWSSLPSFFSTDVWHYTLGLTSNYYRPVFVVWLMINSQLFGMNTALWHASAIALHLLATLLVYVLGLRLTGKIGVAAAAALLFGVHPAHLEVVDWLSGATESLFAVFALAAILCQLQGRRVAALVFFALALFEKETAVVLPLLLAACFWLETGKQTVAAAKETSRVRSAAVTLAYCAAIGLFYIGARVHALGSIEPQSGLWTLKELFATIPGVAVFYLRQLLVPVQYSVFYSIAPVMSYREALVPAVIVAAAGAVLIWLASRSKAYAFCVLLLVIPILPVFNLTAFAVNVFQQDRYLYLPSAGLCLLLAMLGASWMQRWPAAARIGTVAVVAAGLVWVNLEFSGYWKDNLTLYRHGAEVAPDNPRAIIQLAEELVIEQQPAEALPLFQKALLEHNWYDSYENIGYCYLMMREFAQAEGYLYRAISLESTNHIARSYLAEVEWRLGHLQEAETQARQALQLRKAITPKNSNYHALLGGILADEGDFTGARAEFQAELHEYPSGGAQKALADLEDRINMPQPGAGGSSAR